MIISNHIIAKRIQTHSVVKFDKCLLTLLGQNGMKSFEYGKSTVAKIIQYEGGRGKANYHGSVQLHRMRQSYLRGVEVPFNITIISFWSFFFSLRPL